MRPIVYLIVLLFLISCNESTQKKNNITDVNNSDTAITEEGNEEFTYNTGEEYIEDTIPVFDQLTNDYPNLYKLVVTLKDALETHNEDNVIEVCDQEHYETQKGLDISDYQYVFEIMNISGREFKDDENYKRYCKKVFKDIEKVEFTSFDPVSGASNDEFYFFGTIRTSSGENLSFNFTVVLNNGEYFITGPVG